MISASTKQQRARILEILGVSSVEEYRRRARDLVTRSDIEYACGSFGDEYGVHMQPQYVNVWMDRAQWPGVTAPAVIITITVSLCGLLLRRYGRCSRAFLAFAERRGSVLVEFHTHRRVRGIFKPNALAEPRSTRSAVQQGDTQ